MKVKRQFLPGSSWLYYRIFTSPPTAEVLLLKYLAPLVKKLELERKISCWFFIRYSEEGYHIRFRFETTKGYIPEIIESMHAILQNESIFHLVSKVSIDTYLRELERYGEETIELVEKIFCEQSKLCVNHYLKRNGAERFKMALRHTHEMLILFYPSDSNYSDFIISKRDLFKKEFNPSLTDLKKINKSFALQFSEVFQSFTALDFVGVDTTEIPNLIKQILKIKKSMCLDRIVSGLVHMHINRIFATNQRGVEFLVYDYLVKMLKLKK